LVEERQHGGTEGLLVVILGIGRGETTRWSFQTEGFFVVILGIGSLFGKGVPLATGLNNIR
jgi:hypothetical protein